MEQLVDVERHPVRGVLRTVHAEEGDTLPIPWEVKAALVLLAVFVVALTAAGFYWSIGFGLLGLAVSTLVASILLGMD